jgi:DNA gyrase subunit A
MPRRDLESILTNDLPIARQQVAVYEAISVAASDAHAVLDVILTASNSAAARAVLQQRYGFTEVQSSAVLDMQFRRMTSEDREILEKRREEVVAEVAALEVLVDGA